jgi:hypothetical protein
MKNNITIILFGILILSIFYLNIAKPFSIHNNAMGDAKVYQGFVETIVNNHKIDFQTYHGYHGQSIFILPFYYVTGSPNSIFWVSIIFSFLNIPMAYFTGKLYGGDNNEGLFLMMILLCMPSSYIISLLGLTEPILIFWYLFTLYLLKKQSSWCYVTFAIAISIKPLALGLIPAMLYFTYIKHKHNYLKGVFFFILSFSIIFTQIMITVLTTNMILNYCSPVAQTSLSYKWYSNNVSIFIYNIINNKLWISFIGLIIFILYSIKQKQKYNLEKFLIISLFFTIILALFVVGLQARWCVPVYLIIICLLSMYKIPNTIKLIYLFSSAPVFILSGEKYKYLLHSIKFNEMNEMIIIYTLIIFIYILIQSKTYQPREK